MARLDEDVPGDPQLHGNDSAKAGEEGTSPIAIAKPVNVQYDPALLLHPPGCLVHVTMTKDHPQVKDSSLGPRALEGIFFGNEPS